MAKQLVAAGVVDVAWYRLKRPELPADPYVVARHYLDNRAPGVSLNPLFAAEVVFPKVWDTMRSDPLVNLVKTKLLRATHPLFDQRRHAANHPEALEHPGGPLGHFLQTAGPDAVVPTQACVEPELLWGPTRELLMGARERVWSEPRDCSAVTREWDAEAEARWCAQVGPPPKPEGDTPLVSVVMAVRDRENEVSAAIASVASQTMESWELIVVDDGSTDATPEVVGAIAAEDPRVVLVCCAAGGVSRARNEGLARARGRYVAFLDSDNTWTPDFLRLSTASLHERGARLTHSAIEGHRDGTVWYRNADGGIDELLLRNFIDLNALVVERALVDEAGYFDETLRRVVDWDLVIRLARLARPVALPFIGVVYDDDQVRPRITTTELFSWREVVLSKYLIDWDAEAARERIADRISIIMPTFQDWQMTYRAVESIIATTHGLDVEIVVIDNGSAALVWDMLSVLLAPLPSVTLVRQPSNTQFALGSNLGFAASTGERVVFLNNDTEVQPGWLEPLLGALDEPDVVAVQPLLLYPDGTVQCAGVVFPERAGLPVHFLAHHPAEDALALGTFATHALTAAAVLMMAEDFVHLRGFDPIFRNGWEDVDFFLRAGGANGRCFRVVTSSIVVHHEGKSPDRGSHIEENRKVFGQRWMDRLPHGPEPLWEAAGFEVAAFVPDPPAPRADPEAPVLSRPFVLRAPARRRADRLRWAIKIAAPAGRKGSHWGDSHFAESLARSLRALNQDVVIDRREAHQRQTSYLDDVVLNLRGLVDFAVQPGALNLMWVISHPDLVTAAEIRRYDRVFAASNSWSAKMSEISGRAVLPLLQATDPALFNPGRSSREGSGPEALFVGSSRKVFRPVVRDAVEAGLDLRVHGLNWDEFLPGAEFVHGFVPNSELGILYRTAGVVLNDHWEDMAAQGFVCNRVFDAVAAGARVVTDYVDGIEDLFHGAAQVYRGVDDLRDLAGPGRAARFPDEGELLRIAEYVAREHSFDARARTLLDVALEAR